LTLLCAASLRLRCRIVGEEVGNSAGLILGLIGPAVAEILANEVGEGTPWMEMAVARNKKLILFMV
jgi:hypothetical protein